MNKMFGSRFSTNINNFLKFNKKKFSINRYLKTGGKNAVDQQTLEVVNLLKRQSIKKILITLGASYLAAYAYFGCVCLWEDNMSAKKYEKFRTLNYILTGGCLFTVGAFAGANFIFNKTNPTNAVSKMPNQYKFVPFIAVLGFGLLLNENNILVSVESFIGLGVLGYLVNNIRLVLQAKQRRPILAPLLAFGGALSILYILKAYFVVKQRINFKNFLYDYNNRKEHILN